MSYVKCQVSNVNKVKFCRIVPPEFLRSILGIDKETKSRLLLQFHFIQGKKKSKHHKKRNENWNPPCPVIIEHFAVNLLRHVKRKFLITLDHSPVKNDWRTSWGTLRKTFIFNAFWLSTNGPMDQWSNGPMVQWTKGPMEQWTNRTMPRKKALNSDVGWGPLHGEIGLLKKHILFFAIFPNFYYRDLSQTQWIRKWK